MKVINETSFKETFQYFDKSIVLEIIELFIAEYPERIAAIKNDIASRNFESLKFNAHSIKGVIANFFATEPQQFARELETKGTHKEGNGLEELVLQLDQSCLQLIEDLQQMKEQFKE